MGKTKIMKKEQKTKEAGKTSLSAIFLAIACAIATSFGHVLFKLGSKSASFDLSLLTNHYIIAGFALYALGFLLLVLAFKHGELSVLYPVVALSYIWVILLSSLLLKEQINAFKWLGSIIIIIGISLIGKGSRK